jgi:putative tryptophan/tyrosine transport system substrate-binding protein
VTSQNVELLGKRLEVLRELIPKAAKIGLLLNPSNPNSEPSVGELQRLADTGGWELHLATASSASEIDSAYARLAQAGVGGVLHATDAPLTTQRDQLVALAARYRLPSIYLNRETVEAGGLLSYGIVEADLYREVGVYTGRILHGTKPSDLPIAQSARIQLFLNLKTAKALGLTVPQSILVRADEVIE